MDYPPKSAEQIVAGVLEPGEKVLWGGRPNAELALGHHKTRDIRYGLVRVIIAIAGLSWIAYWLMDGAGSDSLRDLLDVLPQRSLIIIAIPFIVALAIVVLRRLFKIDDASRLSRYFQRLSYGMTDRRLLILEAGKITHEFGPDDIGKLYVHHRTVGCGDVIWFVTPGHGRGSKQGGWHWERTYVGFKAIPNFEGMKRRIEDWIRAHQKQAGQAVEDFIEDSASSASQVSDESTRRVANHRLGLIVDIPEEWRLKSRRRRKPYGKIFLDFESWEDPEASDEWNVLRAEGPAHASVEIHVDNCEPVLTLQSLTESTLSNMFGGKVVDTNEGLNLGALVGFSITRSIVLSPKDAKTASGGRSVLRRHTVFHGGGRQIAIVSTWPDGAELLEKACDVIVASLDIST